MMKQYGKQFNTVIKGTVKRERRERRIIQATMTLSKSNKGRGKILPWSKSDLSESFFYDRTDLLHRNSLGQLPLAPYPNFVTVLSHVSPYVIHSDLAPLLYLYPVHRRVYTGYMPHFRKEGHTEEV